jgi:hypothetical protein
MLLQNLILWKKKRILINLISIILFTFLALYLTILHNKVYLFKLQDLSLFLPTKMFFLNNVNTPGGFLSYLGLFFTQFFYYPWVGSLIFIFFLFVIQFLTIKAFKLHQKYFPLSFVPSLLLLLALSQLGYIIFTFESKGYIFSNLFGIIIVLSAFWIYRNISRSNIRILFLLLFIIIFFPLTGFYSELAVFLFLLFELVTHKKDNKKGHLPVIILSLIFIIAIPFLYYRSFHIITNFPKIYLTALPVFNINADLILWLPFFALFVFLICAVFNFLPMLKLRIPHWLSFSFPSLVFLLTIIGVYHFSYDDENFRTELAMERAIFENEWNEVLRLSHKLKGEPTRLIVMDTYLALRKLHIAGDKMFYYKTGIKPFNSKRPVFQMDLAGKMLYYQYGKINYCYRWCMQDMVKYGLKIENLKYFVKSCLLNKEFSLAKKYNDVLMKTLFHKSWAKKYQRFIENPEDIPSNQEFRDILPLLFYKNVSYIDKKNMLEAFLRNSFISLSGGSFELLELSLQYSLELKDIERFWTFFFPYIKTHSSTPVHYQEAALLYSYLKGNVDVSKIKFDSSVLNNFRKFIDMMQQYKFFINKESKSFFSKNFGNTFWYYFFFDEQIKVDLIVK